MSKLTIPALTTYSKIDETIHNVLLTNPGVTIVTNEFITNGIVTGTRNMASTNVTEMVANIKGLTNVCTDAKGVITPNARRYGDINKRLIGMPVRLRECLTQTYQQLGDVAHLILVPALLEYSKVGDDMWLFRELENLSLNYRLSDILTLSDVATNDERDVTVILETIGNIDVIELTNMSECSIQINVVRNNILTTDTFTIKYGDIEKAIYDYINITARPPLFR